MMGGIMLALPLPCACKGGAEWSLHCLARMILSGRCIVLHTGKLCQHFQQLLDAASILQ